MRRTLGIIFGLVTHLVFAWTVWRLFWFLKLPAAGTVGQLEIDFLLALAFAVPHSALLHPAVRRRLERFIPSTHYGCFFCLATCLSLDALFLGWQSNPVALWQLEGWVKTLVEASFLASWVALIYSLSLNGLGYQTGWTPWWHWLRRRPLPPRRFEPRGAYRWMRHPVYLSFLGLIWCTPTMTVDRAILTGVWTAYILVGSCLKDQRLVYYLGDRYREYQSRVVGYPLMIAGPLARVPLTRAEARHGIITPRSQPLVAECRSTVRTE